VIPTQVTGRPKTVIYEAGPISISANAQHKAAAQKFLQYWVSDEGQTVWSKATNFVSSNANVPGTWLDPVKKKISADIFGDTKAELIVRFWEATLETITLPACAQFDTFSLKPADYPAIIDALDKLATDAWVKYRAGT
jgi:ABC-type Fe3+ transport system substrate-binding protein